MIDSCSIENRGLISIEQALKKIEATVLPIQASERVILKKSLGRILATPVYSSINIPSDENSAMDGYAFSSQAILPDQSFSLTLAGTSWAGKPFDKALKKGQCIRIFTGAVIPENADSVIMQEHIQCKGNTILFPETTRAKENIRPIGSDINKNEILLAAKTRVTANNIGLLASAGIYDVAVKRKLNIAFLSTGDELIAIGQALQTGQIYDSNRYTLSALLSDSTLNASDLGVIADNKKILKETLLSASKTYDIIISTGGASVGEADYIHEVLEVLGDVSFWKIAIKPGKPLAFGKINNSYFFGLPGNPVSVISTFHKIVYPALQRLSGEAPVKKALQITAICTSHLKKMKGRQEYQRGILTQQESGEFVVSSAGKQGSNIMSAMSVANCYIVLPTDCKGVAAGEKVTVEPFAVLI